MAKYEYLCTHVTNVLIYIYEQDTTNCYDSQCGIADFVVC